VSEEEDARAVSYCDTVEKAEAKWDCGGVDAGVYILLLLHAVFNAEKSALCFFTKASEI
jgi:hypothetical protein